MDNKEIAKEIVLTMIDKGYLIKSEFPGTKTTVDMVCEAYKTVLATLKGA